MCFNNLDDQEAAAGDVVLNLTLEGPAIEGRAVQPYQDGMFYVSATFSLADWPTKPPALEFITKIWHPLVNYETQKLCSAAIPELWDTAGYKPTQAYLEALPPEERAMEPMLSAFRLLRDLLLKVHERSDITAVNTEAMQQLAGDGKAFDERAARVTADFAKH
jgi:ubiquitin-protein ligase